MVTYSENKIEFIVKHWAFWIWGLLIEFFCNNCNNLDDIGENVCSRKIFNVGEKLYFENHSIRRNVPLDINENFFMYFQERVSFQPSRIEKNDRKKSKKIFLFLTTGIHGWNIASYSRELWTPLILPAKVPSTLSILSIVISS